jgi:hypothetical protein
MRKLKQVYEMLHGNPIVANAGGLQSQDTEGVAVVDLLQARGNAGCEVLRLSSQAYKTGEKMAKTGPIFIYIYSEKIPILWPCHSIALFRA